MNVRELHSELRDLPLEFTELDIYTEGGSKVVGMVVRNTPEEGPHVVLALEHPEDASEDES